MTALPDVPDLQLYTSAEAAKIVRGGDGPNKLKITAATLDNLARSGRVTCTMIGRKRGWTLEQIAAVVAHCATSGGEEAKASAPKARDSRTAPAPAEQRGTVAPFRVRPGSRYAASTC